ncbi:MAG: DUF739 family protein [Desulfobulbaceae bacterium]|nr:DUF739 family protein [Desulfobulbaceae bacterium]
MNLKLKAKIVENYGAQWRFAAALQVQESVVSRVVRGKLSLSDEQRRRWADLLKTQPEIIFQ